MRSFTLEDDGYCFACGKENSSGLGLEFRSRDDMMVAEFTPLKQHHLGSLRNDPEQHQGTKKDDGQTAVGKEFD